MKKRALAFCLLLTILTLSLGLASAGGMVVYLEAEIVSATSFSITWLCTDKDDPPFTIGIQQEGVDRVTTMNTYDTYFLVNHVSPDTTYTITVSSEGGQADTTTITTPGASDYSEYNYSLKDTGLFRSTAGEEDYAEITALNSKTLPGEIYDYDFSLMFQFRLTASKVDKSLGFELMLHMPNGDFYTLSDILWYTVKSQTVTQYYTFNELLEDVLADYGEFPAGEYTLSAYFESNLAAETTFTIE